MIKNFNFSCLKCNNLLLPLQTFRPEREACGTLSASVAVCDELPAEAAGLLLEPATTRTDGGNLAGPVDEYNNPADDWGICSRVVMAC